MVTTTFDKLRFGEEKWRVRLIRKIRRCMFEQQGACQEGGIGLIQREK